MDSDLLFIIFLCGFIAGGAIGFFLGFIKFDIPALIICAFVLGMLAVKTKFYRP